MQGQIQLRALAGLCLALRCCQFTDHYCDFLSLKMVLDEFEIRLASKCKSSGKVFSCIFFPKLTEAWLEELSEEGGVHSTSVVSELLVISLHC